MVGNPLDAAPSAGVVTSADEARWGREAASSALSGPIHDDESDLTHALIDLVDKTDLGGSCFHERLAALEVEYGDRTYSQLIFLLCHLQFDPAAARAHWQSVNEHRAELEEKWGSRIDPRVALTSYFLQVHRQLDRPTIIEMRLLEETLAYAYRDELTGLRNFRFFELYLFHELLRSDQYSSPLSLVMFDVDDFKNYNDCFGHAAGNDALATIGRLISECCRRVDVPARYGGEEFAIILPATPKLGARMVADRVRSSIEAVLGSGESGATLTVSGGVATYPGDADCGEELIHRADEALYQAKSKGKNRVEIYGEHGRSYHRVETALSGRLVVPGAELHDFTTVDVSEGGLRFVTDIALPAATLVDLRLRVPGHDSELKLGGRVVKCEPAEAEEGGHDTAIRVVDVSARDRMVLSRYLGELSRQAG
jgi:diguanylate cyclase (GGDEF)-like protein